MTRQDQGETLQVHEEGLRAYRFAGMRWDSKSRRGKYSRKGVKAVSQACRHKLWSDWKKIVSCDDDVPNGKLSGCSEKRRVVGRFKESGTKKQSTGRLKFNGQICFYPDCALRGLALSKGCWDRGWSGLLWRMASSGIIYETSKPRHNVFCLVVV